MAGTVWSKFFWSDWRSDPRLRMCSLAARGLWIELLAIMAEATPVGYLRVGMIEPSAAQIGALIGVDADQVKTLLAELESAGVFSRDRSGCIYSRRMVRDAKLTNVNRKNGSCGGASSLRRQRGIHDRSGGRSAPEPEPESRVQSPEVGADHGSPPVEEPTLPGIAITPMEASTNVVPLRPTEDALAIKEILFGRALKWLAARVPRTETALRTWIGRLIRDYGEVVAIEAFRRAQSQAAVEPIGYIERTCRNIASGEQTRGRDADPLAIAGIKEAAP